MLLSENTAGLGLLHEIKVQTWLLSVRDACIKNSPLSRLGVINSTHENREKFKFFHEFVHVSRNPTPNPTQKDIADQNIFEGIFLRLRKVNCLTKRRRIRNDEFLRFSVTVKICFHNF